MKESSFPVTDDHEVFSEFYAVCMFVVPLQLKFNSLQLSSQLSQWILQSDRVSGNEEMMTTMIVLSLLLHY